MISEGSLNNWNILSQASGINFNEEKCWNFIICCYRILAKSYTKEPQDIHAFEAYSSGNKNSAFILKNSEHWKWYDST